MKKIILLLGLCVTFYACDGNSSAAKELITADLIKEMDGEAEIQKVKVKKISEGDDHWDDSNKYFNRYNHGLDLAFYHSTVELLVIEDNREFNEGDKLKVEFAYAFETDDDGKLIEIDDQEMISVKVKKKGESNWEDIN